MKTTLVSDARRGGLLVKLLLVLVALFAVGAIAWTLLLPSIVVSTIRSKTGFNARVESLSVNPFTGRVHARNFVLTNPEGWPGDKPFVDLRELRVDADVLPLLRGRFEADEVAVDVASVTLVRNQQGALNATVFEQGLKGPAAAEPKPAPSPQPKGPGPQFMIRRLALRFDQLTYADHSGRRPTVRDYKLGVNRELRDVDRVSDLLVPFQGAALGLMADALQGLFPGAKDFLNDATHLLKDTGKKATETLKGLLEKAKP